MRWVECSTSPWPGSEALRRRGPVVVSGVLTDSQWARIEPPLPDRTPRRGGRWRDHRQVIDAIAWNYRTGSPWMDLPAEFGSWKGAYSRLRNWAMMEPGSHTPSTAARRAPARPARSMPTAAKLERSRSVRWPRLRVRPDICSANV
ncbi:transposase [Streptomyces sp. NBC_00233]|uniref:transposase n=1 Tax=Streptomyces sp. NBC_00233 TaxID=2975686 RepID=UPI003390064F